MRCFSLAWDSMNIQDFKYEESSLLFSSSSLSWKDWSKAFCLPGQKSCVPLTKSLVSSIYFPQFPGWTQSLRLILSEDRQLWSIESPGGRCHFDLDGSCFMFSLRSKQVRRRGEERRKEELWIHFTSLLQLLPSIYRTGLNWTTKWIEVKWKKSKEILQSGEEEMHHWIEGGTMLMLHNSWWRMFVIITERGGMKRLQKISRGTDC